MSAKTAKKQQKWQAEWVERFASLYQSEVAHAFVLHFNVEDYVHGRNYLPQMLRLMLASKQVFVIYDRLGFRFLSERDRTEFLERAGFSAAAPAAPVSKAQAAIMGMAQNNSAAASDQLESLSLAEALSVIDVVLRQSTDVCVFLPHAHLIWPESESSYMADESAVNLLMGMRWGSDMEIGGNRNVIIATTEILTDINSRLRGSRWEPIELSLPSLEERLDFLQYLESAKTGISRLVTPEQLARVTAGLMDWQLEDLVGLLEDYVTRIEGGMELSDCVKEIASNVHEEWVLLDEKELKGTDFPPYSTRQEILTAYMSSLMDIEWEISLREMAQLTAGLNRIQIEDIILRASLAGHLSAASVQERKAEIIRNEYDTVTLVDPTFGFERIGELDHMKAFMMEEIVTQVKEGHDLLVPKGVLMMGPPGTGKSLIAQALAKELGFNMLVLDLAKIFGQYVGNTERNMEKAIAVIRSQSPLIVFIDEIDQSVSRNDSGSAGVDSRVFKRLLEFMSEPGIQGKVIFLAATNRPDLIDPALMRPGRFDVRVPFFPPSDAGRKTILQIELNVRGIKTQTIPDSIIERTKGWTGAELAGLARKIASLMGKGMSLDDALNRAIDRLIPSTNDIDFYTQLAMRNTNDLDLVPDEYITRITQVKSEPVDDDLEENERPQRGTRRGRRDL